MGRRMGSGCFRSDMRLEAPEGLRVRLSRIRVVDRGGPGTPNPAA